MRSNDSRALDERDLERKLLAEGFMRIYVWQDGPNAHYPAHTHRDDTAHVILAGEMTLILGGRRRTYRPGERVDVAADTEHTAEMGPQGCRYMVGERPAKPRR